MWQIEVAPFLTARTRRVLAYLLPMIMLSSLLGSCANASASQNTRIPLVVQVPNIPANLNPSLIAGAGPVAVQIDSLIMPSAFYLDSADNYHLNTSFISSAEVVSVSPQIVVYNFNPNARWSDGNTLSALDMIYTWEAQKAGVSGTTPAYMSSLINPNAYNDVESVVSNSDGSSATVTFFKPLSSWQALFDPIFPARYFQPTGFVASMSLGSTAFPTVGNMTIESYTSNEVILKANSSANSSFSEVVFVTRNYNNPKLSSLPTVTLTSNLAKKSVAPMYVSDGSTVEMYFNTTLLSLAVRNAIAYAINREAIWDQLYGNTILGAKLFSPPGNNLYVPGQQGYRDNQGFFVTQDLGRSERSFIQAGLSFSAAGTWEPLSSSMTFSIAYQADSFVVSRLAPLIAKILTKMGLLVSLEPFSGSTFSFSLNSVDAVLAQVTNSGDPAELASEFVNSNDFSYAKDAQIVSNATLLSLAKAQVYPLDSAMYYDRLDQRIWGTMAGLPIISPIEQVATNYLFTAEQQKQALIICTAGGATSSAPLAVSNSS